jgi:tetratricopeptide (TPR) repeat protein
MPFRRIRNHGQFARLSAHLIAATALLCLTGSQLVSAQAPPSSSSALQEIESALRMQQYDQAIQQSQAALRESPDDKRVWSLEGMAWAGKASSTEALKAYHHALTLDPRYLPALEGAAQIEYQRRTPAAKPLLLRILAQRPGDPTSNTMLGILEYAAKDCAKAIQHFALGGTVLASQPDALGAYGVCLAQSGHSPEAIPIFQQALNAGSSATATRYNLALAQWKANRPEQALDTLQPLLQSNQESDAVLLAADIDEAMHHTQQAIDLLRKTILANPKNIDAYLAFASLSYDHASMQVGIDIINAGLTQLPNEARLYQVRGVLYIQLAKFDEAAADFERASQLNPRLPMLGTAEGLAASQQHNDAEAIARFRRAVKAQPKDAFTHYLLAEALSQEGPADGTPDSVEEIASAKEACRLDPTMLACHDLLASIYLEFDHPKSAEAEARAALAIDANDPQAIYHLILALRTTVDKAQLASLLKRLAEARAAAHEKEIHDRRFALQEVPQTPAPAEPSSPQ